MKGNPEGVDGGGRRLRRSVPHTVRPAWNTPQACGAETAHEVGGRCGPKGVNESSHDASRSNALDAAGLCVVPLLPGLPGSEAKWGLEGLVKCTTVGECLERVCQLRSPGLEGEVPTYSSVQDVRRAWHSKVW